MKEGFWDEKNVLVTGAGGFKGSHLVESLSKTNATIVSLIRDVDPKSYFETQHLKRKSILVFGDLKDGVKIADILSKYDITTIFHLGAQPIVQTARLNPKETLESNIMGTVNILEAARNYSNVNEIVVVSSDKAYGPSKKLPYIEKERLEGKAPYDVSKSCADLISQMYSKVYNMPITIARCVNVFGPGDLNINRIVPGALESIIRERVLKIRSDGKMIRDYVYVKDSVEAYIKLAENIDQTKGEAFNIAGGNVLTVLGIVDKISKILKKTIETVILDQAEYEIPNQYLDDSKIRRKLNWKPQTDFEKAIIETYGWYEKILKT